MVTVGAINQSNPTTLPTPLCGSLVIDLQPKMAGQSGNQLQGQALTCATVSPGMCTALWQTIDQSLDGGLIDGMLARTVSTHRLGDEHSQRFGWRKLK
jgi:hypothetical protein